jgi:hypothetical protein
VRYAPFNSHTSFFLGSCHIVFWGTPTRLSYEVPIECLKVDSIPRRLTRRLISTLYNTTPGRWRAPQSNTGSRDRRTTICKRLRSVSSRSAIFLTETLRLRTICVLHRRPLSIRSPLVSLAHVGSEEAAHEVHLAGVSLPTVQTVFRLDSVRAGTCVVRCASQGRCWDNQNLRESKQYLNGNNFATANSWTPLPRCYQDLSSRAPPTRNIEGFCGR